MASKFEKPIVPRVKERLSYEEIKRRVLAALASGPASPASLAPVVWPDNKMTPQAGALALGPSLKRMASEKLVVQAYYPSTRRFLWRLL